MTSETQETMRLVDQAIREEKAKLKGKQIFRLVLPWHERLKFWKWAHYRRIEQFYNYTAQTPEFQETCAKLARDVILHGTATVKLPWKVTR